MSTVYQFEHRQYPCVLTAALRARGQVTKMRFQTASKRLRLLYCILLMPGGVSLGYITYQQLTGTPTVMHWSTVLNLALSYLAVFGSIFITVPTMIWQALATRANQGTVEMTVDAEGGQTRNKHIASKTGWQGMESFTRSKLGFILWFVGNQPAIPFAAFEHHARIKAVGLDAHNWLETSR